MNRAPTFLYRAYYSKCAAALQQAHEEPQDDCFGSMIDLLRIVERIHVSQYEDSITLRILTEWPGLEVTTRTKVKLCCCWTGQFFC